MHVPSLLSHVDNSETSRSFCSFGSATNKAPTALSTIEGVYNGGVLLCDFRAGWVQCAQFCFLHSEESHCMDKTVWPYLLGRPARATPSTHRLDEKRADTSPPPVLRVFPHHSTFILCCPSPLSSSSSLPSSPRNARPTSPF